MEDTDSVKLRSVVKELIKSVYFVYNWKRFYRALETNHPNFVNLERQYNLGPLPIDELLMETLGCWVSKDSSNATIKKLISVLESENFNDVADKLKVFPIESRITNTSNTTVLSQISPSNQQSSQLEAEIDVPHWFEVRPQAPKFTGRVDELKKLDKFCTNNDKLILVAGMGGIGKSQLVVYFANQFYNDKNGSVIWLQGKNEKSFIKSIERLTGWKKPKKYSHVEICAGIFKAFKAIYAKPKTNPTLIIIDNVDQRNLLVEFFIQKTKSLPAKNIPIILVTSRKIDILGGVVSCILNLEGFDPSEAIKFVLDSYEGESDNTAVDLLCKRLQYFPLALRQAVAYIQMKRQIPIKVKFTIRDYLGIIELQKIELLDHKLNEIESDYNLTTLTTWNATLESIKSQGEVGIAAANILQLLAYSDLQGIYMPELKRMYEGTFVPHYENVKKHVNDAIELLRSYSMCNIQVTYRKLKMVSMHCLLQEVIRLQSLMQSNTTLLKSVITARNWHTYTDFLPNLWCDCLKSDSFVRENIKVLYDCCVELFSVWKSLFAERCSEMVEECNKAVIRVLGNESQEVFVIRKCIALLKESITNKYTSAVLVYLDIKDILDKDQNIAERFANIVNGIVRGAILQKYNNDKQIPITGCINFYKFSVLNAKKKMACLKLTKWVINILCLKVNTEKLHEIQYFLCDLYYKNELEKRTLLTFLKCIEVGIQVIKEDNRCYDECTPDRKEAVEGICRYSSQIKHQILFKNKRLFFQEDAAFLDHLLQSTMYPNNLENTFSYLQNLDQVFIDDYSKEVYDPEKMERSVHILSENLKSNKVCHIDACFVAHIMLAKDNLNGNQLNPAATAILLEINNKPYRLFEKFLIVVKYDRRVFCEIEVVSKIDYIRRLPIVQHSTEHSVFVDAVRTLMCNNKDSKGLILNSVNFDKDFNIENTDSSTKQNIDYLLFYSYFDDITIEDKSDNNLDLDDVLTVENGLFVWKRKQREESNCKIVFDKMKYAVLQDFELEVIAALKTVKQSTDSNFRYETFWCAARLLYFKLETIRKPLSPENNYGGLDKVLVFLDECLSLTETDTERIIFRSTINWWIFSYAFLGYLKIRGFLIFLRYSELNIVLLNKILEDSKSDEMSKLQLEVFKLIEQNLIRIPQNGYQVIKLITLKLIKQGNFRFSLSEFRMAASSNHNDKNLAQVIQNENEKILFIQTINKKLSLSNWNESEIPVDLSIALFYHLILDCKSIQGETLSLLENILIFLEINDNFSEMVNVGRNAKRIYAVAKLNNQTVLDLVICKITHFLAKAEKKYMLKRLQKPF